MADSITIQYFAGCPNYGLAEQRVHEAIRRCGTSKTVVRAQEIVDEAEAERVGFRGSPTVLVDGVDPFAQAGAPVGFACRVYTTPAGREGAPSVEQLCDTLR